MAPFADSRIVSLLPAATEIAWMLGLGERLVGRSHECDVPEAALALPPLTRPRIDPSLPSDQIHQAVGQAMTSSQATSSALFELDIEALVALAPDVILSQDTCDVCAISGDEVHEAVRRSGHPSRIVPLSATSLAGLWTDIRAVGEATGSLPRAREAVARLQARCDSVACRVRAIARSRGGSRPRVAVVEWLDPPMAAGNWGPEIVHLAGGDDVLGRAGEHSHWITWADVAAADPDVVIVSPCGFTLDRIIAEVATEQVWPHLANLRATGAGRLWAMDGHHLLNRPGPRLVDSLEVMAEILNPDDFLFAASSRFATRIAIP
jgi:iron complex transport system substrate-binding protein